MRGRPFASLLLATSGDGDGLLGHAVFMGLREDKAVAEVSEDEVAATDAIRLTHPEKLLFPKPGITKKKLADYYRSVAGLMLPHLAGRPVSLLRCPDGVETACFFQRHPAQALSDASGHVAVVEADGGEAQYLRIDDVEGLHAAVQAGTLELHVWGARADAIERPEGLDVGCLVLAGLDRAAIGAAVLTATTMFDDRAGNGRPQPIPSDYCIANTSDRVVSLIVGTAKLSNGWDGIRANDLT